MQLYQWLTTVASDRGSEKALVYRDTYLSWRGLLHRVDRRAQELSAMAIGPGAWVGLMLGNRASWRIKAPYVGRRLVTEYLAAMRDRRTLRLLTASR